MGESRRMDDKIFLFPEFRSSDPLLNEIWDYRCKVYNMHIKNTPEGYVVTEFLPDVPWAGKYNAINCPAMFHIQDGRWLTDSRVISDYIDFWCNNPEDARRYSFPLAASAWEYYLVTGDMECLRKNYEAFCRNCEAWEVTHGTADGFFRQSCDRDGMEYSISGDGVRPTLSCYMYGEYRALQKMGGLLGLRNEYGEKAEKLRKGINEKLWNRELRFYGSLGQEGEPVPVRELVGYIPYIYDIPEGRTEVFSELWEPEGFYGACGPTTAERRHPDFNKSFPHECLWNGPSWPFATTQVLLAMITLLEKQVKTEYVNPERFLELLRIYARSQHDTDGRAYIDENLDPDTGEWVSRRILHEWGREDRDRGRDYNHSAYMDLILRGVCGITPTEQGFRIDPLRCPEIDFTVSRLMMRGRVVKISREQGKCTVTVDGLEQDFTAEIVL